MRKREYEERIEELEKELEREKSRAEYYSEERARYLKVVYEYAKNAAPLDGCKIGSWCKNCIYHEETVEMGVTLPVCAYGSKSCPNREVKWGVESE